MEYLRGSLQAELKQETGPWTIGILKTSNIIIIYGIFTNTENIRMLTLLYPGAHRFPSNHDCTFGSDTEL